MKKILLLCTTLLVGALMLTSCKGAQEVVREVPVYIHDTTRETHNDIIRENDTTIIERTTTMQLADSAVLAKLEEMGLVLDRRNQYILVLQKELEQRIRETEKTTNDTSYRHNETAKPIKEIVEVERELTRWQKFQMACFWLLPIGIVVCVLWLTRKTWWKWLFKR